MKHKFRPKLLTAILLAAGAVGCGSPETMHPDEAMGWITAFTPELVDQRATIRIETGDSLRKYLDTLRPLNQVFRFRPSVRGTARYADGGRFVEFEPAPGALKQGHRYTCRVRLNRLTGVDTLSDFGFDFTVSRREVELTAPCTRIDPERADRVIIESSLLFNVAPEPAAVDPMQIETDAKNVSVRIIPTDDPHCYLLHLSGIERRTDDIRLRIRYRSNGGFAADEICTTIPGMAAFKLLDARRVEAAQPWIELNFSDPLSAEQDLEGLVTLDGIEPVTIFRHGAQLKLTYPPNGLTDLTLRLSDRIRSRDGRRLGEEIEQHFTQEVIPPAVEIPVSGTILPDEGNLRLPFRAVNLAAVDVEVVKVFTDNILTFLQENELNETTQLRRVGRLIYRRTIRLDDDPTLDLHRWQNFSVNLQGLFRQERGAIYNIRLSFRQAYSLYGRTTVADFDLQPDPDAEETDLWDKPVSYLSREAPDCNWDEYDWRERNDPSKPSYYMLSQRMPEYNLAASRIGLIVKRGAGDRMWCAATDLTTSAPLAGIRLTARNFQMREIGSGHTDREGFAELRLKGSPYVVTASDGRSTTYLKVNGGHELSTSRFDVGGRKNQPGIKGFIYGERGVWRPGDEIHLTLIVEDRLGKLPANHPVTMELYTPDDHLYERQTQTETADGIHVFHIRTTEQAPTGSWEVRFRVGGQIFRQTVRIETIRPNRLKIDLAAPDVLRAGQRAEISLETRWLTGPAAAGLHAKVEMALYGQPSPFAEYEDYTFSNPLNDFTESTHDVLSVRLDSLGLGRGSVTLPANRQAPGPLQAVLIARVEEPDGGESLTSRTVRYAPFEAFAGVNLGSREFETDRDLHFPVVAVDAQGKPLAGRQLEYRIYRLDWSWWWEGSAQDLDRYVQSSSAEIVASGSLTSAIKPTAIPFRIDYPAWGKYLVLVRDLQQGHTTGGVIFIDWPDWRGHAGKSDPTSATMLSVALDKRYYETGETATVYLPRAADGRVLLSVENGSEVISRRWIRTSADRETAVKLPVTRQMAPNFYLHAMLLQPWNRTSNDLPIRMYGIDGATVVDHGTILHPEIEVADEIRPQQEFSIRIRERNGRPMSYTLAVVDEGLLDITSFRTPDPWAAMNRREALGVRTWDMYQEVIGSTAGRFTPILSIGGDEALRRAAGQEKRFNPVVRFLGPFTLNGGTKTHRLKLPMYVGSVRVMVVAARDGAYGHAERNVTVRSPLMLLPTLPRTLACGDRVRMPVNLFALERGIGEVHTEIRVEGPLAIEGERSKRIVMSDPGERMLEFGLTCDSLASGWGRVTVTAVGNGQRAVEQIAVEVRNPLPEIVTSRTRTLPAGASERFEWQASSQGKVRMSLTSIPAIDFEGAFAFFENYAHECTEQLSSRALYLLHARRFLPEEERLRAEKTLPALLKAIASRQLSDGGFVYWPGMAEAHEWVTSMAGAVMTEARRQGFNVPTATYGRWIHHQTEISRRYRHTGDQTGDLQQAYRLYTLVQAGERPSAAMNRLRESEQLPSQALLRLAAAYVLTGRRDVAADLLARADAAPQAEESYATFGSSLRDEALALETWVLTGAIDRALASARHIVGQFSPTGASTQEVAFVSVAMDRLAGRIGNSSAEIAWKSPDGATASRRDFRGSECLTLDPTDGAVTVENRGGGEVSVSLTTTRRPSVREPIKGSACGIEIKVGYTDAQGRTIDVDRLAQGEEFLARIEVLARDRSSESMALSYVAPSGWEIWNDRLMAPADGESEWDHTDIRDGRICWYFALRRGSSRSFTVRLRAAYAGRYLLPPTICEDMYDSRCRAMTEVGWSEVVR